MASLSTPILCPLPVLDDPAPSAGRRLWRLPHIMRRRAVRYEDYLRRVPKAELHCHFEGTVRPATFAELARKHGVALPTQEVDALYAYDTIEELSLIHI